MLPKTVRRRAGFTLIELLVVMGIIVTLIGLLMPAVQQIRNRGTQTENFHRMNQLSDAVGRLKNDLKLEYVPSQPMTGGGFTLKRVYSGSEPELTVLLRAFPNMSYAGNPDAQGKTDNGLLPALDGKVLDANQTLCFFVCGIGDAAGTSATGFGFSNNPSKPFTPVDPVNKPGEQRKGPWIEFNPKMFAVAPNGFPWIIDPYGTPYAYFASVGGKQNNYGTQSFMGAVSPYVFNGRAINEKGFQIISAGRDKTFGPGGVTPPVGPGADDQAHFQRTLLGAGLSN